MTKIAGKRDFYMKLETSQISKMIHNVLSWSFDDGGSLHFHRFSETQRETYALESQDWVVKTHSSASATFSCVIFFSLRKSLKLSAKFSSIFCTVSYTFRKN